MAAPIIPPPPDYSGVPSPPDAGGAPPNPYAGPVPQGIDTPNRLGRILAIARQHQPLDDATKISLVVPGAGTFLGRLGMQAGAQGAGALARGEGLGEAGKKAAIGAAGQAVGEGASGAVRLGLNSRLMSRTMENVKNSNAFNKAFGGTLDTMDQQAHREAVAKSVMESFQAKVPALKSLSADTKGMLDAVYGKGPELVSKEFDTAMQAAAQKAKGTLIELPIEAANALKLKGQGSGMFAFPTGKAQMSGTPQGTPNFNVVKVDAAEAINAMLGKSLKEPAAYKAVAQALDDANLGDPAARQAYKSFRALTDFIDRVKGLKGEQVNPESILGGLTNKKSVDLLRKRGEGDIFRGPMQAARGAPTPREIPEQTIPEGMFKTMKNPLAGHPWVFGLGGGAAGHALGGWPGHVIGFGTGAAASNMLPKEIVTRAPLPPQTTHTLNSLPALLSALGIQLGST